MLLFVTIVLYLLIYTQHLHTHPEIINIALSKMCAHAQITQVGTNKLSYRGRWVLLTQLLIIVFLNVNSNICFGIVICMLILSGSCFSFSLCLIIPAWSFYSCLHLVSFILKSVQISSSWLGAPMPCRFCLYRRSSSWPVFATSYTVSVGGCLHIDCSPGRMYRLFLLLHHFQFSTVNLVQIHHNIWAPFELRDPQILHPGASRCQAPFFLLITVSGSHCSVTIQGGDSSCFC